MRRGKGDGREEEREGGTWGCPNDDEGRKGSREVREGRKGRVGAEEGQKSAADACTLIAIMPKSP